MEAAESGRIEKRVLIRAPRARVWRALTDPAEFSRWFGVEMAGAFQPGVRLQMISTHEGPAKGVHFHVDVQQRTEQQLLSWRWHPGMPDPAIDYSQEPTTLVEFRLEDAEGGTLLTVTESGFDRISLARRARLIAENTEGWEYQTNSVRNHVEQAP